MYCNLSYLITLLLNFNPAFVQPRTRMTKNSKNQTKNNQPNAGSIVKTPQRASTPQRSNQVTVSSKHHNPQAPFTSPIGPNERQTGPNERQTAGYVTRSVLRSDKFKTRPLTTFFPKQVTPSSSSHRQMQSVGDHATLSSAPKSQTREHPAEQDDGDGDFDLLDDKLPATLNPSDPRPNDGPSLSGEADLNPPTFTSRELDCTHDPKLQSLLNNCVIDMTSDEGPDLNNPPTSFLQAFIAGKPLANEYDFSQAILPRVSYTVVAPLFIHTANQLQMGKLSTCEVIEGFLVTGLPTPLAIEDFQRSLDMLQFREPFRSWGDFDELTSRVYEHQTYVQSLTAPNNGAIYLKVKRHLTIHTSLFATGEQLASGVLPNYFEFKYAGLGSRIYPHGGQPTKRRSNFEWTIGIQCLPRGTIKRLDQEALMVVAVQHSETIADAQATLQETLRRISMPSLSQTGANGTPHPIPVRVIVTRLSARIGAKDGRHPRDKRNHRDGEWINPPQKQKSTNTIRKAYVLRILWCGKSLDMQQEFQTKLASVLTMQENNVVPSRLDGHYMYWALKLRQLDSFLEDATHLIEGSKPLHTFLPTPMAESPLQLAAVLSRIKLGFSGLPPPSISNPATLPVLMCMTLSNVQTSVENNRVVFLPRQEISLMYHKPMAESLCDFLAATCGTPRSKKCLPAGILDTTFQQFVQELQCPECVPARMPPAETDWSIEQLLALQDGRISLDQLLDHGKPIPSAPLQLPQPSESAPSALEIAQQMIAQCTADPALLAEVQRHMANLSATINEEKV